MPLLDTLSYFAAGPCPYLPDREWRIRTLDLPPGPPTSERYEALISNGWRRNGSLLYQNHCPGCNRCIPIRVPSTLVPRTKSHRRVGNKNRDLQVTFSDPRVTDEFQDLYARYQTDRHPSSLPEGESFGEFFCQSGVDTKFMEYRTPEGKLLGLGLLDILPSSLSSVYFVFDPLEARRSLGIFSLFREALGARDLGKDYLHLGFWVPGSPKMEYKGSLYPHDIRGPQGWVRREQPGDPVPLPRPWSNAKNLLIDEGR